MKKVSVVIPNYNNAHYLGSAIQSVLRQSFTDYEIIVVDDGSTDNSKNVVGAFGDKVRYICQENKGLGGARNTGILASNAEFIGLLDADDEWKPTYLEKMMALTGDRSEAVVYYCAAQGMDSTGKDLPQIFGRMPSSNDIYQNLLRANFIIPSTVLFRRSTILEAGLFEEKNRDLHGCEDWDLWLRLCPTHHFIGTAEPLVRYRLHTNTFSANPAHMQHAARTVIEKNFGPDDSKYPDWSEDKRRAFGGVYRYQALTSIQKQGNWEAATVSLRKAMEIDPTLATDLNLFYELAFGTQPPGYRETTHNLHLEPNATQIMSTLGHIFNENIRIASLRRMTFCTANYAIGLVAYNTGQRELSKRFLYRALVFSPKLLLKRRAISTLAKSYLNPVLIDRLKHLAKKGSHAG